MSLFHYEKCMFLSLNTSLSTPTFNQFPHFTISSLPLFPSLLLPNTISVISDWSYSSGFVSGDMMSTHLPPPGPTSQILMCGPPPMIKFACLPNLEKLGFSEDMYVPF